MESPPILRNTHGPGRSIPQPHCLRIPLSKRRPTIITTGRRLGLLLKDVQPGVNIVNRRSSRVQRARENGRVTASLRATSAIKKP